MINTEFDRDIRDAWRDVAMPSDVKARTLARIETLRQQQTSSETAQYTYTPCCQANAAATQTTAVTAKPKVAPASQRKANQRRMRASKYVAAIAACFILALVGVFGVRAATIPTAFVDIDVNPSIGLSLNRFGYVLNEESINDDGADLLGGLSVVGKPYEEAISAIMQSEAASGYLGSDSFVSFTITADRESQGSQLMALSDACLSRIGCRGSSGLVDAQTREAARQAGMGAGKYVAALELVQLDPAITVEDCTQMTMGQLHDKIDEVEIIAVDSEPAEIIEQPAEPAVPPVSASGAPNDGDFFGSNRYPLTQGVIMPPEDDAADSNTQPDESDNPDDSQNPEPIEPEPNDQFDSGDFNFLK